MSATEELSRNAFAEISESTSGRLQVSLAESTNRSGVRIRINNGMVRRLYQASSLGIRGERRRLPLELHTIGIDLGKTIFHLVGIKQLGEVVVHKKFSRKQQLHFTANLQGKLIGMEACGGSRLLGRALREQGYGVRLMTPQYVKPYVNTNKSDHIDAEAIAEAVGRPKMRFVPIKTDDQLDLRSLHRVRERWLMRRTASHRPDSWLAAGAWNHFAAGAMP